MIEIAIGAIIVALIFDFVNGFNDSANSVATVIGTRVMRPLHAVALSAAANFVGPFVFGVAVATTIAKGIVSPDEITVYMIIGGLACNNLEFIMHIFRIANFQQPFLNWWNNGSRYYWIGL